MKKLLFGLLFLFLGSPLLAQGPTYLSRPYGIVTDTPTMTITTGAVTSSVTSTPGASQVQVQMKFGTVTGTYTTCTIQMQTSMNDTDWLTIGTAASITVTTGTINTWVIIAQTGTTSVTSGAVSASAALVFGTSTRLSLACSGAYGTTAPVVIKTVAR